MSNFNTMIDYNDSKIQAAFDRLIKAGDVLEPVFKKNR